MHQNENLDAFSGWLMVCTSKHRGSSGVRLINNPLIKGKGIKGIREA